MSEQRDLRADLRVCEKAIIGPWKYDHEEIKASDTVTLIFETVQYAEGQNLLRLQDKPTAEFIAQARTGWPEAIERAITSERDNGIYLKIIDEQKETIVGCNRVYKESRDQNAALREENDLQRKSIQQLSAQVVGLTDALVKTLPIVEELAETIGYGHYKPDDPRDFTPDFECCSKTEISNWKNDCAKTDAGKEIGEMRFWGIGTYKLKDAEMIELREKIKTALSQPDPGAEIRERLAKLEAEAEAAKEVCEENAALREANDKLSAQVAELREGLEEIRARCELRTTDDDAHWENYYEAKRLLSQPDSGAEIRERLVKPEITDSTTSRDIECTESYDLLYRAFDIKKRELQAVAEAAKKLILLCNSLDGDRCEGRKHNRRSTMYALRQNY